MKFGLLIIALLLSACTARTDIPLEFPTPPPPPAATPLPKLDLKRDAELEKKFAEIAKDARGKVGVAAVVLETGEAALLNADDHYAMQSVYKLPISMAVMDQVGQDKLDLDEQIGVTKEDFVLPGQVSPLRDKNPNGGVFTIRELIRLALVESDGSASDVLMRVVGGPSVVQDYLTKIGINDMKIVNTEKEFAQNWENQYQNWTTPVAAVELLRWLDRDANGWRPPNLDQDLSQSQQILQFMMEATTGPKRIKGLLPLLGPLKIVAHKTGTSGNRSGITAATNDIGIMYLGESKPKVAIAVFVADSPADDKTRDSVIARTAKAAWDRWNK
jgi:beta-lactamase class A